MGEDTPRMVVAGLAHNTETVDDMPAPRNSWYSWLQKADKGLLHPACQARLQQVFLNGCPPLSALSPAPSRNTVNSAASPPFNSGKPKWVLIHSHPLGLCFWDTLLPTGSPGVRAMSGALLAMILKVQGPVQSHTAQTKNLGMLYHRDVPPLQVPLQLLLTPLPLSLSSYNLPPLC